MKQAYQVWYYSTELQRSEAHIVAAHSAEQATQAMLAIAAEHDIVIRILSVSVVSA